MKAVILAGGLGTRLSEETSTRPKPMVEIGGRPILWHVMKIYAAHGVREFVICCGYKGYVIKEYFANYLRHNADVTFDLRANRMKVHQSHAEDWRVTLVDTGEATMTGGRLKRVLPYVGKGTFCFTYGDGVADVDIRALLEFHRREGRLATMTVARPSARFGAVDMKGSQVTRFREKPAGEAGWINGGFFVLSPRVGTYIEDDATVWEREPLEQLAAAGQLTAYRHAGFWQPMDTLRDKKLLEDAWESGRAPWKVW